MGRHYPRISSWLSTDSRGFPGVGSVRAAMCLMIKIYLNWKLFHSSFDISREELIINSVSEISSRLQLRRAGHFSVPLVPSQAGYNSKCRCAPFFQLGAGVSTPLAAQCCQEGAVPVTVPWEGSAGSRSGRSLPAQLVQDYALLIWSFSAFCALNHNEGT